MIESLVKLMKANPVATGVVCAGVFAAGITAGAWLLHADQCHAQTSINQTQAEANAESIKLILQVEQEKAKQKQAVIEQTVAWCNAGVIKDPVVCANAKIGIVPE